MISIKINEGETTTIEAKGHAMYNCGNDIVCSGVSMLFYAFCGYLIKDDNVTKQYKLSDGYSFISFKGECSGAYRMFVIGLNMISDTYPDNVKLEILKSY